MSMQTLYSDLIGLVDRRSNPAPTAGDGAPVWTRETPRSTSEYVELCQTHLIDVLTQADRSVLMAAGEVSAFADKEFADKFSKTLETKTKVSVTLIAGPVVVGEMTADNYAYNWFLELAKQFGPRFQVYYNHLPIDEQHRQGYFHFRVVDGGRYIHFEKAHGYEFPSELAYFGTDDAEAGKLMTDAYWGFVESNSLRADSLLNFMRVVQRKYFRQTMMAVTRKHDETTTRSRIPVAAEVKSWFGEDPVVFLDDILK